MKDLKSMLEEIEKLDAEISKIEGEILAEGMLRASVETVENLKNLRDLRNEMIEEREFKKAIYDLEIIDREGNDYGWDAVDIL